MAEVSSLTTVDKFVRKLLHKNRVGNAEYNRYLTLVVDGIQRLNFNYLGTYKTEKLSVDTDTKTVDYPDDCVRYISLSVDDGDGKMWTFTFDNKILFWEETDEYGN